MKIIKRYANRKLYDTERSCYVTLDEIADMVREGVEIKIVDQKTDEDLTSVTLTQIIFEEEKRSRRILPLPALRSIIQSGGDFLQRVAQPVQQFREDTQRSVDRLLRQPGEKLDEGKQNLREFANSITRTIDEMQAKMDERLRAAVDNLTHVPELQDQVEDMKAHLERVDERLTQIERMLDRLWEASPPGESRRFGRV